MKRTLAAILLFLGCGGDGSEPYTPPVVCAPGSVAACACPAGNGSRTCLSDGSGFGVCACPVAMDYAAALQGNWIVSTGASCLLGLNFSGNVFSRNDGCVNDDGASINLESDQGTFTADAEKIYVTVAKSTCSDAPKTYYIPYDVTAVQLTVTTATELIILGRNTAAGNGSGGVAKLGCYDANGAFTPSPLAPI